MYRIVVAMERNRGIGRKGMLPWPKLKGDMKFYRELTTHLNSNAVEARFGLVSDQAACLFGSFRQFNEYVKHLAALDIVPQSSTLLNAVVMGRLTWESLPNSYRPLPDRINMVITSNPSRVSGQDVLTAGSLADGLKQLAKASANTFVIGGGQLYKHALVDPECQKIYLTEIFHDFECDVFFPNYSDTFEVTSTGHSISENGITYCFKALSKKTHNVAPAM